MDFKDCINFANENKTCYLATVDGDQPRVRALGMHYADDIAIRKRFYEERGFLMEIGVKGPEDPFLMAFDLRQGEAFFWTFADKLKEADIPRIKFG